MIPKCRICGKAYEFPECELEARMYPQPGAKGVWEKTPGENDRAKFLAWTVGEVKRVVGEGQPAGELGLNLILMGRKEGIKALLPLLQGTQQQRWDFIVKRLFPLSFTLTHARPGGYETDRLRKWLDLNYQRLSWSAEKRVYVLG